MGKIIGKDCCCNDWKATIKELWAEYQNMIRSVKGNGITAYPDGDGQVDISAIVNSAVIDIDDALSLISTNPVQNKVITAALNDKVSTDDLSPVAISGDYDDLTNKPDLSIYAESSDLSTVAISGSYADLSNKPTIYANHVQASAPLTGKVGDVWYDDVNGDLYVCTANTPIWTKIVSGTGITVAWGDITGSMANQTDLTSALNNKADTSSLSTVATTGDYDDLLNKPTIPAAPVQSNWNEADNTSLAYIQNKPALSTVATSGSYDDLSNKPTIPSGADLVPSTSGVPDGYVLTNDNGTPSWMAGGSNDNADIEIRIKPIELTTPFTVTPASGTTTSRCIISKYHKFIINDSNDIDNYFVCKGRTVLTQGLTGSSVHRCSTNISSSDSIDEILSAITINKSYSGRLRVVAVDSTGEVSPTQVNTTDLVITDGVITKPSSIYYEGLSGGTSQRTISKIELIIVSAYTV